MSENVVLNGQDINRYLDENDKSELSRIIWKMEQLKSAENDPNQLKLDIVDNQLVTKYEEGA
ncbi:hypothetical protein BK121_08715 [Paenibacillus odorifer]|uniref:Uncharacterized protein n=1 Tax=Paenibacillus odorifer TaxID=189426 RepID=A0ABX3GKJ1_9BACL|nr:hypothetical protein [Paenibacillus odorifer]OMC72985.1 hypothetical protein BK121_08715 [Paenibacillus odorifer]OMD29934.1 hypothetical protein BSO21_18860 [Paenibacillus odorifer]